jgi:hypothetical protein
MFVTGAAAGNVVPTDEERPVTAPPVVETT